MCSLENLDATDTIPKENSGISVDQTVEPNLTPTIPSPYAEKQSTSTPQGDSDVSDSTSVAPVVETTDDHTTNHMPASPSAESALRRPKSIILGDIPLHSPSSEIVCTPFAIDTRFEYPFPDISQNCGSGSSSATSDFFNPAPSTSPSSNSFPILSTSPQLSFLSYNATHPKMKIQANPPIPPNLIKRHLRRTLNLLVRRRSSGSNQQSTTSDGSAMANNVDEPEQQALTPPGSSTFQERGKT